MSLWGKSVTELTEEDLQGLITNRVRESQTLEYKRPPYGRNDEEVREMLRDISSMANAFGGDLLIGVEEDGEGVAIDLPGVENTEAEAQRMLSSCLSNIEERISGLVAWPVPLGNGRHVIVVRIPRSHRAPHMVTYKGLNQFWVRHDRQKSPMSIHEIREACLKVEGLMEKLERFLEKRKRELLKGIGTSPYYIVTVTPIFVDTEVVDIQDQQLRNLLANPPDQRPGGCTVSFMHAVPLPTLHGLMLEDSVRVIELFRNGHLELRVKIDFFCQDRRRIGGHEHPILDPLSLTEYPVSLLRLGKAIYAHLGVIDPAVVSLALYNIHGFTIHRGPALCSRGVPVVGHDPIAWGKKPLEISLRPIPSLDEPDKVAKGLVDRIWQAFGYEQAPFFDEQGNFRP